jgi:hypothetical protein
MATVGYVNLTLIDNGGTNVSVPSSSLQFHLGCSSGGTVGQFYSTRSISSLKTSAGYGPGPEQAANSIAVGGTAIFSKLAPNTHGTASAVVPGASNTGATVMTLTLDSTNGAFDTNYLVVAGTIAGTLGTAGGIKVSLDAGRNYTPSINLGTATTYAIPNTGITLNFTVATIAVGDTFSAMTTEPLWTDGEIQTALTAFAASPYGPNPLGLIVIAGKAAGSDVTAVGGYLVTLAAANQPVYVDCLMHARDLSPAAVPWGGSGETDGAWQTSILTSFSAVAIADGMVSCAAGYYNMQSNYYNLLGMTPRYRRPASFSLCARAVTAPPNRSWGRFKDGALPWIVVDPVNDPLDGFVYHNEAANPGLCNATARFMALTTQSLQGGNYYLLAPYTMAQTGSQYFLRPYVAVANVARYVALQVGQQELNDDVRTVKATGALDPRDAGPFQTAMNTALSADMTQQGMVTSASAIVDTTNNVQSTNNVNVAITLVQKTIILSVSITIQYSTPIQ